MSENGPWSEHGPAPTGRQDAWQRWSMAELRQELPGAATAPRDRAEELRRKEAFRRQAELKALREQVLREAREEGYQAGFAEGKQAGHVEGLAEGRQQAQRELQQRIATELAPLAPLANAFAEALATLDEALGNDLVELALATGQQLAGEALKARPRQVLVLIRALLHTEPPLTGQQRLWLHPLDLKLVEEHLGHELQAAGWKLQPDDQISRGGCRVTSASGELDATWESRWEAVTAQVRRRRATPTQDDVL